MMKLESKVVAAFIIWLFKVWKVPISNCIAWWYDNCDAAVAQEINKYVIELQQIKP